MDLGETGGGVAYEWGRSWVLWRR